MATIDITPAGNKLFQVEIHDDEGSSTHRVGVPDGFPARAGVEEVALQDVVLASVRYRLEREARTDFEEEFSLSDLAESYPDYVEQLSARVREIATGQTPPTGMHVADADPGDQDDKLVEQVKQEQDEGQVSRGQDRF